MSKTKPKFRLTEPQPPESSTELSNASAFDTDEVLQVIREQFAKLKLELPARPRKSNGDLLNPTLPSNLTTISDDKLGELYGDFAAMIAYVRPRLAMKELLLKIQRRRERIIRAVARAGKRGTVHDKDYEMERDQRVIDAVFDVAVAEGVESMTSAILSGLVDGKDTLSREITRRISLVTGDR